MTDHSTPASQPPAPCSHVWNDFGALGGRNVSWCPRCDTLAWTGKEPEPSPARSDKHFQALKRDTAEVIEGNAKLLAELARSDMPDTERAKFEAWHRARDKPEDWQLDRKANGDYAFQSVGALWDAWQARAKLDGLAERTPSSDLSVEAILEIVAENTGRRINLSNGDLDIYIAVVRAALARSATAGTTLPTESKVAEGGASALRAEPASQHGFHGTIDAGEYNRETGMMRVTVKLPFKGLPEALLTINGPVFIAPVEQSAAAGAARQGGVTCNKGTSDLAGTTAPAPSLPSAEAVYGEIWDGCVPGKYERTVAMPDVVVVLKAVGNLAATAVPGDLPSNADEPFISRPEFNDMFDKALDAAPSDTSPAGADTSKESK